MVVESGPVMYDDAAAEEEEEEDEEACVSAMDLLGANGQSPLVPTHDAVNAARLRERRQSPERPLTLTPDFHESS